MPTVFILAAVFFVVSTLFSILGMGGGILYVPVLLFTGFSIHEAPAISLILISATSLAALFNFWRNNRVDWKLALVIDPPTDIMAFVGGFFASLVPAPLLEGLLAGVLIIAGSLMLRGTNSLSPHLRDDTKKPWHWRRRFNGVEYTVNLPLVLTATGLIGILSGMLGITGGIIKLPIMVLLCGVPMDIAVATSTVMVAVTALFGLAGHAVGGTAVWRTGLVLAGPAVAGGLLGSRISLGTKPILLKRAFGIVVWLIALRILFQLHG